MYDNEIGTDRKEVAWRQAGNVQRRGTGRASADDDLVGRVERDPATGQPYVVAGNREPVSRNVVLQIDEAGIGQRAVDGRKTGDVYGAGIDGRDGSDRPACDVDDSTRTVGEGADIVEGVGADVQNCPVPIGEVAAARRQWTRHREGARAEIRNVAADQSLRIDSAGVGQAAGGYIERAGRGQRAGVRKARSSRVPNT